MSNRIASNASNARMNADLTRAYERMLKTQGQITSGKRLQKPSDGPADVAMALDGRTTHRRMEQFATSLTDALGWLRVSDDTLVSAQSEITRARTSALSAVSGALSGTEQAAVANEIDGIRDSLLQHANTSYQNRSVFSGTAAVGTAPYGSTGDYVNGDLGDVKRVVAEGVSLKINLPGPEVFGTFDAATPANGNLFQVLDTLSAAVRAGDATAVHAALQKLDAASDRMATAQVRIGGLSNQVEEITYRNETMRLDVEGRLSDIEDTDLAEALIGFKSQEAAYQGALAVTAKVVQPSLLDFLR
jgi:flagellar hook-associated protein 3 FlgL